MDSGSDIENETQFLALDLAADSEPELDSFATNWWSTKWWSRSILVKLPPQMKSQIFWKILKVSSDEIHIDPPTDDQEENCGSNWPRGWLWCEF